MVDNIGFLGVNKVLVLDNTRPKYNGPTSTSLEKEVAHSFSEERGLVWTIKSSYSNKFRFMIGISVDWISHHKHEREILLMNQYLPIASSRKFDHDPESNVDQVYIDT